MFATFVLFLRQMSVMVKNKEILNHFSILLKESGESVSFKDFDEFFSNYLMMINIIKIGIPFKLFDLIYEATPFTDNEWSHFLDISTKSFQRYKKTDRHFKRIQSEKIIELTEVTYKGLDVFGSIEKFKLWLDTPNYALGKIKPIELLNDSYGKELVLSELVRIDHGILS